MVLRLPLHPRLGEYEASGLGPVGISVTGGFIFNHLSNPYGGLAVPLEGPTLDSCQGHSSPVCRSFILSEYSLFMKTVYFQLSLPLLQSSSSLHQAGSCQRVSAKRSISDRCWMFHSRLDAGRVPSPHLQTAGRNLSSKELLLVSLTILAATSNTPY